jgi:phosphate transport system permease protein
MKRRAVRKLTNLVALALSGLATAIGLFFLGAILWTLIKNGLAGLSPRVFTEMTPPPGSSGGLLNAIYGSVVMTLIGILIGGPVGMLAGTYLPNTAHHPGCHRDPLVNDVPLSARRGQLFVYSRS